MKLNLDQIEAAVRSLIAGRLQLAEEILFKAAGNPAQRADAAYLHGVTVMMAGDANRGLQIIKDSFSVGIHSNQLFHWLGRIWEGTPKGATIRGIIQRYRLLPFQAIGRLGASRATADVEPWWFSRKMINFFPPTQQDFAHLQHLIDNYVVKGWAPSKSVFNEHASILTMGSCFAQELRNHLREKGLQSDWMFVPPGLNNTFALRHFIDWCVTGERGSEAYWYDESLDGKAAKWTPSDEARHYNEILRRIDGLVLTIGLAEVWYDSIDGGVFWRGIPKSIYDPERHICKVSTVRENTENLRYILAQVRSIRPDMPIIISLSPVPLKATTSDKSCITSDCISKSVLRVAIQELLDGSQDTAVFYWPSFEIIKWLGPHLPASFFGEDGNPRHVNRFAVKAIVDSFVKNYFANSVHDAESHSDEG